MTAPSAGAQLGIGAYRSRGDLGALFAYARKRGIRLLDTAPNYWRSRAQERIGCVLAELDGLDGLRVTSKVGFLPASRSGAGASWTRDVSGEEVRAGYSLSPQYIRQQVEESLKALSVPAVDVLFVHNPEELLRRDTPRGMREKIRAAFTVCEELRALGQIRGYGISTWHNFLSLISVPDLLSIAAASGGDSHGLSAIQLPVSLVHHELAYDALVLGRGPLVDARDAGLEVMASSPLHGGKLPSLLTRGFVDYVSPDLTAPQAAVQFVRSLPFVDAVLCGFSTRQQIDEIRSLEGIPTIQIEHMISILRTIYE